MELTCQNFLIDYLKTNNITNNSFENMEIKYERLNGLSNAIYLAVVIDKSTKKEIDRFILREFGNGSDFTDRDLETHIISFLSENGHTPKVLDTDHNTYRIEEYIHNSVNLPKEKLFNSEIFDNLINILVSYTMISNIFSYFSFDQGPFSRIHIETNKNYENYKQRRVEQNIFEMCLEKMLVKAKIKFEILTNEVIENSQEFNLHSSIIEQVSNYLIIFKDLFYSVFPQKGLFVLNHNDVHRLNILQTNENIMLIDHEYSALNLIGTDIVNYCIESCFDYTLDSYPFYEFKQENLRFKKNYKSYLKFLKKFEESYKEYFEKDKNNLDLFEETKTYEYFLRLNAIISLFWILYSVIYFDGENIVSKSKFDYFFHARDRILIFEKAVKEIKNLSD